MKNFNYLILLLFIGNSFMASAQNGKQKKADRLYDDLAYIEAVDIYKELIEKDFNTTYNQSKLGDSYLKLSSPENAVFYYAEAVKDTSISPEYYFKYAQALRGVKRYDESKEWLKKYSTAGKNKAEVDELLSKDIADFKIKENYILDKVNFNSGYSDFSAYEHDGVTYLVSARDGGMSKKNKVYSWNGEPFLDVYQLNANSETVSSVSGDINTVLHEGPLTITKDGKYMYFTRNNYLNNKEGKKLKDQTNNLKLYRATNINNSWSDVIELPFNNNEYSVGNPSLSTDGKTLYFVSDMPNGFGGADLYKVDIMENNMFGNPVNLGNKINTSLDESFPFMAKDSILYFSSNGHAGFGLMDIFKIDLSKPSMEVINIGEPVNSNLDDFAYFQKSDSNLGYFASNREGGVGSDDIYGFNLLKTLILKGQVTDKINGEPIPNATIRLFTSENKQIAFLETDKDGNYEQEINRNVKYPIEAKHIEYKEKTGIVDANNTDDLEELIYNIELDPIEDVEYLAEINNIYFDFDKSNIRSDAAKELDKLVNLMNNKYPELVIKIGSHTDKRGTNEYNEALAKRRAQATYDYLVANGVAAERINAHEGFGEREPAIPCDSCSKEEHQLNRRSMFSVVKMN
ncbi:outer membrane protein OmpA-like peptidoglycan-associated protein [Gillisia mitskevichiae]|uniref:Outer membrane protein OmpA-like peptidoglycan-associated protein n=1 Tax=Gillisia mitskevichiae TaxID=270921 RepID=A0A495NYV5_9FLAO|nr:OmpA family protein [Gillisia mitskevichiae]RKS42740.1 outer membrane protein OmpA-like peptidoglycan-associated protein [Gillisia mitskevichiae]